MKTERGFTLVELLITIVILAIIVAIAVPSYSGKVQKSRRSDATTALSRATMVMESCRSDLATYSGCAARIPATSEESYYNLTVAVAVGGASYTLTATPAGVQADDTHCTTLTLNSQGSKGYTGSAPDVAGCWGG
ncbi:MAG: type IV pilin protein [Gammaproteobacteria bacterium]